VKTTSGSSLQRKDIDLFLLVAFAALKLVFHLLVNTRYGFHRDELATLSDARHLDWGYVAYPPLTPLIGRIELILFGPSLVGFRFFAAFAQSIAIVVTGLITRELGGNRAAIFIAAGATAIAPISIGASALFQYVSFDYLWFVLLAYFIVRLIRSEDPRWWVAVGIVIGLAIETKYTAAFFVVGLLCGILATPLRSHLTSKWLWIGAVISLLIAAPNFLWQWNHHFITLDFLRHIHERDVRIGRTSGFVTDQFFETTNIITVPLWILGLSSLLIAPRDKRDRVLAWMVLVPFLILLLAHGRGYYMGPVYPMLFAAGAVTLERMLSRLRLSWRSFAYVAITLVLLAGSAVAFAILPLGKIGSPLFRFAIKQNGDLVEEIGWPELVREVARIYEALPVSERTRVGIYCANYGEAGAIDLYGPAYGLPSAISGINSYWARGPGTPPPVSLIVLGGKRERLEKLFDSVELVGHTPNPWQIENEETRDNPDIFLCRGLRRPWSELWPLVRSFG
jgi:dolichyl-phosphate-mannose-protein mannosyltransferase